MAIDPLFGGEYTPEPAPSEPIGGPWLQTALFCEKILTEADGTLSAIRIIDRINIQGHALDVTTGERVPREEVEDKLPSFLEVKLLLQFKSGDYEGLSKISVKQRLADKVRTVIDDVEATFKGGEHGINYAVTVYIQVTEPGIAWFDVLLNGELKTRIPFRITVAPSNKRDAGASE